MPRLITAACLAFVLACPDEKAVEPSDAGSLPSLSVTFSQSHGGAFRANPQINTVLPIRLTAAEASTVSVELAGQSKDASQMADGSWVAEFAIEAFDDGVYPVKAWAAAGQVIGEAVVDLHVERAGWQFTNWDLVGTADSPKLHRHGDSLFMTWTDKRTEPRGLYLQAIDGAGKAFGELISLSPANQEVARADVALGQEGLLGIIHQQLVAEGRQHWISVLDLDGNVLLEPSPLEAPGEMGRFQHAVAYDGEAWVAAWRVARADGVEAIRWIRFAEEGILSGPVEITTAGAQDPHGGFLPFIQMRIAARTGHSVVSFNRDYWNAQLDMGIDRNQVIILDPVGQILQEGLLPHNLMMPFEYESHVHRVGDDLIALGTASSLADEELHEPHRVFASRIPMDLSPPPTWPYTLVVDEPRTRGEMILVPHPQEWSIMAWTDERGRDNPGSPEDKIQLFVAPMDEQFRLGGESTVDHVRLFSGMAKLSGQSLGTNLLLVWIDERNATGQTPKPEVFMETLWY